MRKKIGECLLAAGLISEADLEIALAEQKQSRERLGTVLVRLNFATEYQIATTLAWQLGFEFVNLTENPPDPSAVVLIPKEIALRKTCVAIAVEKNVLTVAMWDPLLFSVVQDLGFRTGYRVRQVVATREEIFHAIVSSYPDTALARTKPHHSSAPSESSTHPASINEPTIIRSISGFDNERIIERPEEDVFESAAPANPQASETAPIIELVDQVIAAAIKNHASDVHIEPSENGVVVRHRLDGILKEVMDVPKWVHDGMVARIKIMGGMDIAERRLPQDGRIRTPSGDGHHVDFRVSTLRTIFGEKVVLRVLDNRKGVPSLDALGFSQPALEQLTFFMRHQHGMVLVVGPTGSGKTTTLCSALTSVRSERTNIITIEDPVEYQIPGVNQTQINDKIKLTFASALRSILRQDPDVVLVGEIRDLETARIALQAAQTGHLVLSTLHTDDAPSCVTRLTDLGVQPYVTASALVGVIAQRLLRRLCAHCRQPYEPDAETLRALNVSEDEAPLHTFYRAGKCDECNQTGYRGRVGIYEVMHVSDALRRLVTERATEAQIREAAVLGGMVTLAEDGLQKVKAGLTSPEELLRVVTEVREASSRCTRCGGHVAADFVACPSCGHRVGGGCPHCQRAVEPEWSFCPYCANSTESPRAGKGQSRRARPRAVGEEPLSKVAEFKK